MKVQFKRNDKCYVFHTEWAYIAKEFEKKEPYVIKLLHKGFMATVYRGKCKPPIINLKFLSALSMLMYCVAQVAVLMFFVAFWLPGRIFHFIGHLLVALGQLMMGNPATAKSVLIDSIIVYLKGRDIFR